MFFVFDQKLYRYCFYPLGLNKGRLSYKRSLQPSKENISLIFVGHSCPLGSKPDPADQNQCETLRIRIKIQKTRKKADIHAPPLCGQSIFEGGGGGMHDY